MQCFHDDSSFFAWTGFVCALSFGFILANFSMINPPSELQPAVIKATVVMHARYIMLPAFHCLLLDLSAFKYQTGLKCPREVLSRSQVWVGSPLGIHPIFRLLPRYLATEGRQVEPVVRAADLFGPAGVH